MSLLRNIAAGLRWMFRRKQVERELDEELRAYQDLSGSGSPPPDIRCATGVLDGLFR